MDNSYKPGKLFVVSASSGAGKTSLVSHAITRLDGQIPLQRVITYTTREPRGHEVNGTDYYFVSRKEFEQKVKEGFFLETSTYDGHLYGSPRSIQDDILLGKSFVMITDRPGAKAIAKEIKNAVLIWIVAPDVEILRQRMIARHTNSHAQIERRIKMAIHEMEEENKQPFFTYHLVNDEFERALEELMLIIRDELAGKSL